MIFQQLTDPLQRGLFWLNLAPPEAPLSRDREGAVAGSLSRDRTRALASTRARTRKPAVSGQRGVTLIEMMVVVMIIAVVVAVSTPSISAGIDAVRLATATSSVAAFLNSASTHAERRERPVELVISAKTMEFISTDPGSRHEFTLPDGISMEPISSLPSEDAEGVSRWLFMPGGAVPAVAIQLTNQHGGRRTVRLDPMTGFPRVESVEAK